ncbi:MAG: CotH kinase family protein [Lachnospiraceae bacterium]|nr:CotH kinase family protein [Lachnospiraceae bacterium]
MPVSDYGYNNIIKKFVLLLPVIILLCLSGCNTAPDSGEQISDSYEKVSTGRSLMVKDKDDLYDSMPEEQVLYLTLGRGVSSKEYDHTWEEINSHDLSWYTAHNTEVFECDALVQFGNEEGPVSGSFGYGDMVNNATVKLVGSKASERQQKSYRIKINKGSGNVHGIKTFHLLKGFTDPFRFTDKLCFDLVSEMDDLMSVRTSFVHLYVRDETLNEDEPALFVDYGLYTMVEPVNKKYIRNRDLDSSGELYGIKDFDFARHEDVIMQPTEAGFNEAEFEKLLEAKGSNDYSKLIAMLDALNDENRTIEEVVEEYFDKPNLYSFMAFNILVDNKDTDTENFYIYSPTGSEKFYIIPWDFDGALRRDYEYLRDPAYAEDWERGIYIYTESKLFGRIIKSKYLTNELSEYITKLHEDVLTGAKVKEKAKELSEIVKPYLYELPDLTYARVTEKNYDILTDNFSELMDDYFYAYYDSLKTPWPFHINKPVNKDGKITVVWDESYLLEGDVTYSLELSDSWDFTNKLCNETGLKETSYEVGQLPPGQYFVKVSADAADGMRQEAYEYYNTEKKTCIHGVMCFYVLEDGTVIKSEYVEDIN